MRSGASRESVWPFGEMSPGYGETKFGTLTILSEVPLWDSVRLRDASDSGFTKADLIKAQRSAFQTLGIFLARHLHRLAPMVETRDSEEVLAALSETAEWVSRFDGHYAAQEEKDGDALRLNTAEYLSQMIPSLLVSARGYALVGRLARMILTTQGDSEHVAAAEAEANRCIDKTISGIEEICTLDAVPLETLTGIQMNALFAAAEVLRET